MKSTHIRHYIGLITTILMSVAVLTACQNNLVWHQNVLGFVDDGLQAIGITSYSVTVTTDFSGTSRSVSGLTKALNGSANDVFIHIRNPKGFPVDYGAPTVSAPALLAGSGLTYDFASDPMNLKLSFTPKTDTPDGTVLTFHIGVYIPATNRTCPDLVVNVTCRTGYMVTYLDTGATGGTSPVDTNIYLNGDTVTVLGNPGNLTTTDGRKFWGWNTIPNGKSKVANVTMAVASINFEPVWIREVTAATLGSIQLNDDSLYVLTGDIDMTGHPFTTLGIGNETNDEYNFTGTLDGDGHTITGLMIDNGDSTNDFQGLFAAIGTTGVVKNLVLKNVDITSDANWTGGIAGLNKGIIRHCAVSGSINGGQYRAGGLVGGNKGTIEESYSVASVTGSYSAGAEFFGGLCANNWQTITNCYARGPVNGGSNNRTGGLVGLNESAASGGLGQIYNSYSTGLCTNFTNMTPYSCLVGLNNVVLDGGWAWVNRCFYEYGTTGTTNDYYGQPLSTTDFASLSTFTDIGWSSGIWARTPGINDGYPYLKYFIDTAAGVMTP